MLHFNSIKVRLEQELQTYNIYNPFQFQFHKGTIRTEAKRALKYSVDNFNSIKVRLEQKPLSISVGLRLFQFHKGTIRTHCLGIYNILIFNRIRRCKVNKYYWKNVDGGLYIFMRSATTVIFIGVTTSQRSKWCLGVSGLLLR